MFHNFHPSPSFLEEYGVLFTLLGSIVVALVALFRDELHSFLFKPEIKVEHSDLEPFTRIAKDASGFSIYIRLKVTNTGKQEARNVRVKVTEIYNSKGQMHDNFDPLFLHWVSNEPTKRITVIPAGQKNHPWPVQQYDYNGRELSPITLSREEFDYVDFLINIQPRTDLIFFGTTDTPRGANKFIKWSDNVDYIKIVIQGDNIKPIVKWLEVQMMNKDDFDKEDLAAIRDAGRINEMAKYVHLSEVKSPPRPKT